MTTERSIMVRSFMSFSLLFSGLFLLEMTKKVLDTMAKNLRYSDGMADPGHGPVFYAVNGLPR